jgi:hypothetical protein
MAAEVPMVQCLKRFRIMKVWFHSTHYCAASSLRVPVVVPETKRQRGGEHTHIKQHRNTTSETAKGRKVDFDSPPTMREK